MNDRIHALTVVLDHEVRDDDLESTINAIRHIRFVMKVVPQVADPDLYAVEMRVRRELGDKLHAVLYPKTS